MATLASGACRLLMASDATVDARLTICAVWWAKRNGCARLVSPWGKSATRHAASQTNDAACARIVAEAHVRHALDRPFVIARPNDTS